ncbi:MAG: InlB B-repeat-containing protein, partial [Clostridia bacterium]|nr:InlB B-repeat-containing protein [Clostridia bacterium]
MTKRKVGLLVFIFAFVVTLSVGIVGCTDNGGGTSAGTSAGNSSGNAQYDFNGEYYTEVDGTEYTLRFDDAAYAMTLGNVHGDYEFDGTTLTLKGDTALTATLGDQSVTVTYNGKTYRFLKKVNYNVTFDTNGGSTVAQATVLNGKAATKPADPKKEGFDFVGWYTDSSFKTPFSFGTAITANTKLYARFAPKAGNATEFTATFAEGGFEPKTTVGGVLYDLPTPEGDFAGWYVSDSEDASKLTYKYDGQTLYSNVTLFAVYSDGYPQPSVTENGIRWSPSGAGAEYALTVTGPDGAVYGPFNTSSTEYRFNFSDKPEGEYAVALTVRGTKKTSYFTNKGLARVSVFNADGYVLTYNAVPDAEKYFVTVECGNAHHEHSETDNGSSLYYDFSGCDMKEGGIGFTGTAYADGFVSSVSSTYFVDRSLAPVTGVSVNASEAVTWNAVEGADEYTVEVKQGNDVTTMSAGTSTSFSLKNFTGNMTVTVYASKKDYNGSCSSPFAYNKTTLPAPSGFNMTERTLSWTAVPGATGY